MVTLFWHSKQVLIAPLTSLFITVVQAKQNFSSLEDSSVIILVWLPNVVCGCLPCQTLRYDYELILTYLEMKEKQNLA